MIITKEYKDKLLLEFLTIPDYIDYSATSVYIYMITNDVNDMKYIGKSTNIITRARAYINNVLGHDTSCQPIVRAMKLLGLEKFKMTVIDTALSYEEGCEKELYYISKFDTISNGYNVTMSSVVTNGVTYNRKSGYHMSVSCKRSKSKLICAISVSEKNIYFSSGLKLFGLLIGRSKDEIKTAAKRGTMKNGYMFYYMNSTDFMMQKFAVNKKMSGPIINYKYEYYVDFIKYSEYLVNFLKTGDNPENFNIYFMTQTDENDNGYIISDPNDFLLYYKNYYVDKIY